MGGEARRGALVVGLGLLVSGLAVSSGTYLEAQSEAAGAEPIEGISTREAVRIGGLGVFVLGFLVLAGTLGDGAPRKPRDR